MRDRDGEIRNISNSDYNVVLLFSIFITFHQNFELTSSNWINYKNYSQLILIFYL